MAWIQKNIFIVLRIAIALLVLSCISPIPEVSHGTLIPPASLSSSQPGSLKLVIWKSHYTVTLYQGDKPLKTYRAVFGRGYRDGDKQLVGDRRTPEGEFYICSMNQSKRFYKFMGLSYPGIKHADDGLRANRISSGEHQQIKNAIDGRQQPPWDTKLGGAIGIHGITLNGENPLRSFFSMNWTDGCIALDNADVDELFSMVSLGTPVTILP
jgi:murein L,D-transpeptidase YafK